MAYPDPRSQYDQFSLLNWSCCFSWLGCLKERGRQQTHTGLAVCVLAEAMRCVCVCVCACVCVCVCVFTLSTQMLILLEWEDIFCDVRT